MVVLILKKKEEKSLWFGVIFLKTVCGTLKRKPVTKKNGTKNTGSPLNKYTATIGCFWVDHDLA